MENIKLDKYYYHEALDRTHVLSCDIETHLFNHPVIKTHKKISDKVDAVLSLMGEIYLDIGNIEPIEDID